MRLQAAGFGTLHVFADAVNAAGIHRVVGQRAFFQQILQLAAVEGVLHALWSAGRAPRLFAVADGLDQQIAQRFALELELAKDIEHLAAQRLARLLQLFQQLPIDIALAGLLGHQVPEMADFGLADAVDAAKALFDAVGVPRQVVVHHQVRALEVDAFAGGVGGEQHLDFGVVPERFLRLHPLFAAHAAMDHDDGLVAAQAAW